MIGSAPGEGKSVCRKEEQIPRGNLIHEYGGDMSLNEMQKLRGKLSRKQPGAENLDQLTGVLKKDAAEAQIALRLREGRGGTIFICDVDHLKKINEKYGHQAGDECLRQAAQILSFMVREGDILGSGEAMNSLFICRTAGNNSRHGTFRRELKTGCGLAGEEKRAGSLFP